MKLVTPNQSYIYYLRHRPEGGSEGVRVGRWQVWAVQSETAVHSLAELDRLQVSLPALDLPVAKTAAPALLLFAVVSLSAEHPELAKLLSGEISFGHAARLR